MWSQSVFGVLFKRDKRPLHRVLETHKVDLAHGSVSLFHPSPPCGDLLIHFLHVGSSDSGQKLLAKTGNNFETADTIELELESLESHIF